jgi:hypothetical protein
MLSLKNPSYFFLIKEKSNEHTSLQDLGGIFGLAYGEKFT